MAKKIKDENGNVYVQKNPSINVSGLYYLFHLL